MEINDAYASAMLKLILKSKFLNDIDELSEIAGSPYLVEIEKICRETIKRNVPSLANNLDRIIFLDDHILVQKAIMRHMKNRCLNSSDLETQLKVFDTLIYPYRLRSLTYADLAKQVWPDWEPNKVV
jgi:hypothetical protein